MMAYSSTIQSSDNRMGKTAAYGRALRVCSERRQQRRRRRWAPPPQQHQHICSLNHSVSSVLGVWNMDGNVFGQYTLAPNTQPKKKNTVCLYASTHTRKQLSALFPCVRYSCNEAGRILIQSMCEWSVCVIVAFSIVFFLFFPDCFHLVRCVDFEPFFRWLR